MTLAPLFTVDELTAAFGHVLPTVAARQWAVEWFVRFTDETCIDEDGYFLYEDVRASLYNSPEFAAYLPEISAGANRELSSEEPHYPLLRGMTEVEKGEFLMSFSDFNLNLLAMVSPELFERVRAVTGDPVEVAQKKRRQMLRIVEEMRIEGPS
jgi:hypothetical protein